MSHVLKWIFFRQLVNCRMHAQILLFGLVTLNWSNFYCSKYCNWGDIFIFSRNFLQFCSYLCHRINVTILSNVISKLHFTVCGLWCAATVNCSLKQYINYSMTNTVHSRSKSYDIFISFYVQICSQPYPRLVAINEKYLCNNI